MPPTLDREDRLLRRAGWIRWNRPAALSGSYLQFIILGGFNRGRRRRASDAIPAGLEMPVPRDRPPTSLFRSSFAWIRAPLSWRTRRPPTESKLRSAIVPACWDGRRPGPRERPTRPRAVPGNGRADAISFSFLRACERARAASLA